MTELECGDVARDREHGSDVIVVNCPGIPAADWHTPAGTVAADNPTYPASDSVIVGLHPPALCRHRPYYSGIRPLDLSQLSDDGVRSYAFPESRLRPTDRALDTHELPAGRLLPSPYHLRTFDPREQRDFIAEVAAEGLPYAPLVQVRGGYFRILDGHKRVWAAMQAGYETVACRCLYIDDRQAARTFVNRHLDKYDGETATVAQRRLEQDHGCGVVG